MSYSTGDWKNSFSVFGCCLLLLVCCVSASSQTSDLLQPVPPANLADIDPRSFSDAEIDLPFYLGHFHQLANAVLMEGPHRGFIDISVWRNIKDNQPYNARIMENILSLAFFYANDQPWNPYYGSPPLRHRLEAALAFWCDIQSPQGAFSEYGPEKWNLAASAFATKFMGESLQWISKGPEIDTFLLARVIAADRKAIRHVLTDSAFYTFGQSYSNQYSNVWAGALAYQNLYPDAEIDSLLRKRIRQSMTTFQSTAGYFYEANGPDWSYNLGTHHSNLHMAFHYAPDDEIKQLLTEKEQAFSDWLAYNVIPEPGVEEFVLNRGIECRQRRPSFMPYGWLLSQGMPLVSVDSLSHPFVLDASAVEQAIAEVKAHTIGHWPSIDSLPIGEFHAYSPYAFLYRQHERHYPTATERSTALQNLPIHRAPFIHQRYDRRNGTIYTFIKASSYYAIFNSGKKVRNQQRLGLGLLGSTQKGALLQTQTGENANAWGSRLHPDSLPFEGGDLPVEFHLDGRKITPQPGNHDLPDGLFSLRYSLGGLGTKELVFLPDRIQVKVRADRPIIDHLPLLSTSHKYEQTKQKVELPGVTVLIPNQRSELNISEGEKLLATKSLLVVQVSGSNQLDYEILITK